MPMEIVFWSLKMTFNIKKPKKKKNYVIFVKQKDKKRTFLKGKKKQSFF
jgi:hypothetical protein